VGDISRDSKTFPPSKCQAAEKRCVVKRAIERLGRLGTSRAK